jgi:hypothetical protein
LLRIPRLRGYARYINQRIKPALFNFGHLAKIALLFCRPGHGLHAVGAAFQSFETPPQLLAKALPPPLQAYAALA